MDVHTVNCRTYHNILKFLHSAQEWNGFLGELQDTIQQQLAESHVQEFADLSDAERLLFLDKGVRALNGSEFHFFPLSLSSLESHFSVLAETFFLHLPRSRHVLPKFKISSVEEITMISYW